MLDYHGLTGQPAGTVREVAARHGVSTVTATNHVRTVRTGGARFPLNPALITAATRGSGPADDQPQPGPYCPNPRAA